MQRLDVNSWIDRVRITLACRDADAIARVPDAGCYALENGIEIQIMHNGVKIVKNCYYGKYMSDIIHFMRGVHEPQEEKCFSAVLPFIRPHAVMLELGCYWGYYSLWFWKVIEKAHCHLVDLDNLLLETAIKNFEINGASGIFTNAGLGKPDLTGWQTQVFGNYVRAQADGSIFLPAQPATPGLHRNIPLITVDKYLADNAIGELDILHSDIQGQELEMLSGADACLTKQRVAFKFITTQDIFY
jgi:FkbM family methyltransferase